MRERNDERYGKSVDNCICCKKPIKDINNSYWAHLNENWKVLHTSVNESNCEELTGARSQGCFPIGNECAKKLVKISFLNTQTNENI